MQAVSRRWEERKSAKWRGDPGKKALAGFEKRRDTACCMKRVPSVVSTNGGAGRSGTRCTVGRVAWSSRGDGSRLASGSIKAGRRVAGGDLEVRERGVQDD